MAQKYTVKDIMDASGGTFEEVGSATGTLNSLLGRNAGRDLNMEAVFATENPLETIRALNRAAIEGSFYNQESNPFLAQRGPTAGETYFGSNPSRSSMVDRDQVVAAVPVAGTPVQAAQQPQEQAQTPPPVDPAGYYALVRRDIKANDPYLQLQVLGPQGNRLTQTGLTGDALAATARRFGFGTEGLASLLPVAEQFYTENQNPQFSGYGRGGQLIEVLRDLEQYAVSPAEQLSSYYNYDYDYTPG